MKTLAVFDFDDTLFKSDSRIIVKSPGLSDKFLTTHEYPLYVPTIEEIFDFSEFETYPRKPEPIRKTVQIFKSLVQLLGQKNVVILTARSNKFPVMEVLSDFGLPMVEVEAVGSSNPYEKAKFIEEKIKKFGYERVVLYEDNERNIAAISSLVKRLKGSNSILAFSVVNGERIIRVKEDPQASRF